MPTIPSAILKQIYRRGSLSNSPDGYSFIMRNHLAAANIVGIKLRLNGADIPAAQISVAQNGSSRSASAISAEAPLRFPTAIDTVVQVAGEPLAPGQYKVEITADTRELGPVVIAVADEI